MYFDDNMYCEDVYGNKKVEKRVVKRIAKVVWEFSILPALVMVGIITFFATLGFVTITLGTLFMKVAELLK